uniref:Uncharacterized protein n=1 Tax=Scytosiphon lomentaria TaxID=27967 RepID=A0A0U1XCE4_SCYLO|nr:hypothetical protein ScloMp23 [Scytosiphon lomentaria]AIQ78547.1 hypothetical protein ScloMp23 [Scytosiphon lomentaria]
MKKKEFSKNNLSKFYYISPLFKKYCRLGLWFGSLEEFNNIRYCEKYLQEYVRSTIKKNLLGCTFLFSCPSKLSDVFIIKFLESRFFFYINFHFLLCFYNNSFLSSFVKSKLKIEIFVDSYYDKFIKEKLEKDFIFCIIKSTNIFGQNFVKSCLTNQHFFCLERGNMQKKDKKKIKSLNKSVLISYTEKQNIQTLFESTNFFYSFKRKRESIGLHNTLNSVYKIKKR